MLVAAGAGKRAVAGIARVQADRTDLVHRCNGYPMLRCNQIGSDQLPTLIAAVYQAFARLGQRLASPR
jgi:hypothetical protein